jgi:hypothetical protein
MGDTGSNVFVLSCSMLDRRQYLPMDSFVGGKFIGHKLLWCMSLMFQGPRKAAFRGTMVSALGDQNIDHIPHSPPLLLASSSLNSCPDSRRVYISCVKMIVM